MRSVWVERGVEMDHHGTRAIDASLGLQPLKEVTHFEQDNGI